MCYRLLLTVIAMIVYSAGLSAAGPAENPEKHADFGGTPDLVLSGDVGMDLEELNGLLLKLTSESLADRVNAASEIKRNAGGCEAVMRQSLWHAGEVNHREIKNVMKNVSAVSAGDGGVLGALLQMPPGDVAVETTTRIATLLVALHSLDSMAGYKVLLDFSARYAGAFRGFIGELMVQAGLKALPALIYGRGSQNRELHMFSVAWIRDMGDPLLSEQIQGIRSSRRLAQLLEAYASVNELDAIDVTLSCANHESEIVRKAARASLAAYGKNAKWSIHREYENAFGDEPESGDYEQWAATLYDAWDNARESKTIALYEKGKAAAGRNHFEEMDSAYRELLFNSPLHPRRTGIAEDYLRYAAVLAEKGESHKALLATQMARRLSEEDSTAFQEASGRLIWLHAEKMRKNGALDIAAYRILDDDATLEDDTSKWATYGMRKDSDDAAIPVSVVPVSLMVFFGCLLLYWRVRIRS